MVVREDTRSYEWEVEDSLPSEEEEEHSLPSRIGTPEFLAAKPMLKDTLKNILGSSFPVGRLEDTDSTLGVELRDNMRFFAAGAPFRRDIFPAAGSSAAREPLKLPSNPDYRILVVGRANAGKTTLLKKVSQWAEDSGIFDRMGNKLDFTVDEGWTRGEHDIENQLAFTRHRQFIFHQSRGFESGSDAETARVRAFILERTRATTDASDRLHAIWYCVPTDTTRPILQADLDFFLTVAEVQIPLIVVLTKFDCIMTRAFQQLRNSGVGLKDAHTEKAALAQEILVEEFIRPLNCAMNPAPDDFITMADMRMSASNCDELIETTAHAIDQRRSPRAAEKSRAAEKAPYINLKPPPRRKLLMNYGRPFRR